MPWKETAPLDQRVQFMAAYQQKEFSFAALCRAFGISRKTGYNWVERYQREGGEGLKAQSRAPQHHPQAVSAEVEKALVMARGRTRPGDPRSWWPC